MVERTQIICRQTLSVLIALCNFELKFGKHGLPVQCPFELLQEVVDQFCAFMPVCGLVQQMVHQQGLITGGGHLCHKNHIVGIGRRLVFVGQIGVNGVSHLMGQCKLAVQRPSIVEQYIGVDLGPGRICTGAFAHIFIYINPAVVIALF